MNKVMIMGRLTKDAETRVTVSGKKVSSFSLAVNKNTNRKAEERQADFFPIVTWDKLAEFCGNYFKKGRQVVIVGRLQLRTWVDSENVKHYTTEIVASEAYFADSKKVSVSQENVADKFTDLNAVS